jgi:hypothetical protein
VGKLAPTNLNAEKISQECTNGCACVATNLAANKLAPTNLNAEKISQECTNVCASVAALSTYFHRLSIVGGFVAVC